MTECTRSNDRHIFKDSCRTCSPSKLSSHLEPLCPPVKAFYTISLFMDMPNKRVTKQKEIRHIQIGNIFNLINDTHF